MKRFELKDLIPIVAALLGGGVTILVAENLLYKIPISIGFFILAVIFFIIPLFRSEKEPKINNMKELKDELKRKFTVLELLNLINDNFKEHYIDRGYAGVNPLLLNISTIVLDLVDYCNRKDKLDELKSLIK